MMLISHKDTSALLADRLTASPAAGAHPFQMPAAPFGGRKVSSHLEALIPGILIVYRL